MCKSFQRTFQKTSNSHSSQESSLDFYYQRQFLVDFRFPTPQLSSAQRPLVSPIISNFPSLQPGTIIRLDQDDVELIPVGTIMMIKKRAKIMPKWNENKNLWASSISDHMKLKIFVFLSYKNWHSYKMTKLTTPFFLCSLLETNLSEKKNHFGSLNMITSFWRRLVGKVTR